LLAVDTYYKINATENKNTEADLIGQDVVTFHRPKNEDNLE